MSMLSVVFKGVLIFGRHLPFLGDIFPFQAPQSSILSCLASGKDLSQGHYSHLMQGPSFGNALDLGPCLPRKVSLAPPTVWSFISVRSLPLLMNLVVLSSLIMSIWVLLENLLGTCMNIWTMYLQKMSHYIINRPFCALLLNIPPPTMLWYLLKLFPPHEPIVFEGLKKFRVFFMMITMRTHSNWF